MNTFQRLMLWLAFRSCDVGFSLELADLCFIEERSLLVTIFSTSAMNNPLLSICCLLLAFATTNSQAALTVGLISNFQDGTAQGWSGGTVANLPNSGPMGSGDFSLVLSNGGSGNKFAMFNTGVNGVISSSVSAIAADVFRPVGLGSGEIRLVLFDNGGNRWTSTMAAVIPDDGAWHNYTFSIREADLTRVVGSGTYSSLTNNLGRIMFRHDPTTPSSGGASLSGIMNFDNITAIPEPSTCLCLLVGMGAIGLRRSRNG